MKPKPSSSPPPAIVVTQSGLCYHDPVWARLGSWPWWPARILHFGSLQGHPETSHLKKQHLYVEFFNWNEEIAQIPLRNLLPYTAYSTDKLNRNPASGYTPELLNTLQGAIRDADAYVSRRIDKIRPFDDRELPTVEDALKMQLTYTQGTLHKPAKHETSLSKSNGAARRSKSACNIRPSRESKSQSRSRGRPCFKNHKVLPREKQSVPTAALKNPAAAETKNNLLQSPATIIPTDFHPPFDSTPTTDAAHTSAARILHKRGKKQSGSIVHPKTPARRVLQLVALPPQKQPGSVNMTRKRRKLAQLSPDKEPENVNITRKKPKLTGKVPPKKEPEYANFTRAQRRSTNSPELRKDNTLNQRPSSGSVKSRELADSFPVPIRQDDGKEAVDVQLCESDRNPCSDVPNRDKAAECIDVHTRKAKINPDDCDKSDEGTNQQRAEEAVQTNLNPEGQRKTAERGSEDADDVDEHLGPVRLPFVIDLHLNEEGRTVASTKMVDIESLHESEKVAFIISREKLILRCLEMLNKSEKEEGQKGQRLSKQKAEIEKLRALSQNVLNAGRLFAEQFTQSEPILRDES